LRRPHSCHYVTLPLANGPIRLLAVPQRGRGAAMTMFLVVVISWCQAAFVHTDCLCLRRDGAVTRTIPPLFVFLPRPSTLTHSLSHTHASLPNTADVPKHLSTTYALWAFFGLFGVHRFYVNHPGSGLLFMFTGGLFGIGWLVDLCLIRSLVQARPPPPPCAAELQVSSLIEPGPSPGSPLRPMPSAHHASACIPGSCLQLTLKHGAIDEVRCPVIVCVASKSSQVYPPGEPPDSGTCSADTTLNPRRPVEASRYCYFYLGPSYRFQGPVFYSVIGD
jgi:hypothetical protein